MLASELWSAFEHTISQLETLAFDDLGDAARAQTLRVIADTVGVSLAGARSAPIARLARDPDFVVPARSERGASMMVEGFAHAAPACAAFLNATAGTFLELDEGVRPTGHPAVHVVFAALAAAQTCGASGARLAVAIFAGYEVTARLFGAFKLTYPLHPHGHFGGIGAAVAVAIVRGESALEPARIAATLPLLSTWTACFEGATIRNAFAGTSARLGIEAQAYARAGFRGARGALESAFAGLVAESVDTSVLGAPLDLARPRITNNYFKFHSACALTHATLDALAAFGPIEASEVDAVEIETVSNNVKLDRQAADNSLSTRFSLPYAAAAAIVHGHTAPEAFEPDARVTVLARRVTVSVAPDLEAAWPSASPARVTLRAGGASRTKQIDNPRGHFLNPPLPEELEAKFCRLVEKPWAAQLYARFMALPSTPQAGTLFDGFAA